MSSLYIQEQSLYFDQELPQYARFFNKIKTRSSITFPTNIINCSIIVKNFYLENADNDTSDNPYPTPPGDGKVYELGWGVEDVDFLSNQAFYSGWMKLISFEANTNTNFSLPNPKNSYLRILAIAECE